MANITVVNKHHKASGFYIGRGSVLGNPYSHMEGTTATFKVATREEAIAKYRTWLAERIAEKDKAVCNALNNIVDLSQRSEGVKLQCFCAPKACHGDVIKQVITEALNAEATNS